MQEKTLKRIAELRRENYSYQFIADTLGLRMNTVKSVCRRKGFVALGRRKTKEEKHNAPLCKNCKRPLLGGRTTRQFCTDGCRAEWWKRQRKIEIGS
ncbi:hypothetical protein IJG04_00310 [Candidatus Saccharibacteria bacterium]|nr:hypothetical protein [Candidatus Saccharibacteria bacterium]